MSDRVEIDYGESTKGSNTYNNPLEIHYTAFYLPDLRRNCREAFEFYQRCFDTKLEAMATYAEIPASEGMEIPEGAGNMVMHARLRIGNQTLMASDNSPACPAPYEGIKGASIAVGVNSVEETERLFNTLADNGTVQMPLEETFWAHRFGMLMDRFGVAWMINYDKEAQVAI